MVNTVQILGIGIGVVLLAVGSWLMHMFFGLMGVGALLALTVPAVVVSLYLTGGLQTGSSESQHSGRRSKGAQQAQED